MKRALFVAFLLLAVPALARDPSGKYANAPNHDWYAKQHNSLGEWCCDKSDGHDWYDAYTINPDGSVTVDGRRIPKERVLTGPNPTGHAVYWYIDVEGGRMDYCFAPGALG